MLVDQTVQAIHELLRQKDIPISNTAIINVLQETIEDLIKNDKPEVIITFLNPLSNLVTESTATVYLFNLLLKVIAKTKNRLAVELINKLYYNLNYEQFINILKLHSTRMFNKIILHNYEAYYSKLKLENTTLFIDFICENITLFVGKYNVYNLVPMFCGDLSKLNNESESMKLEHFLKTTKLIYNILKYTMMKNEFESTSYDVLIQCLVDYNSYVDNKVYVIKSIAILHEINHYNYLRNKKVLIALNSNIYDILKNELCNLKETYEDYIKIIKKSQHVFCDNLRDLFKEIISQFNNNKSENLKVLITNILCVHGFDFIYNILQFTSFELSDFIEIFKKLNNEDLASFLYLYADHSFDDIYSIFPSFMNYCTDKERNIDKIIQVLQNKLQEEVNDKKWKSMLRCMCIGISNLITSQLSMQKNTIILRNSIEQEESTYMTNAISCSNLLFLLLNLYPKYSFKEVENAITGILDVYSKSNLIEEITNLFTLIRTHSENGSINYITSNLLPKMDNIHTLMSISQFFIRFIEPDSGLIAKILSFIITKNNKLQKNAYIFLYNLIKQNKCNVCICETLTSNDYQNTFTCSYKIRLLTLFLSYDKCSFCHRNNIAYFQKIVFELLLTLKSNSSKGRKTGFDVLDEFIKDNNYHEYLKIILIGFKTDNYKIINGSIAAMNFLILNRKKCVLKNLELILSSAKALQTKGKECHKNIIELYKNIILEIDCVDKKVFLDIIDIYIQRKNLYGYLRFTINELKDRGVEISNEMKKLLVVKFKKRYMIDMKVTKKGVVELTEVGKNEDDESDDE